MAFFSPRHAAQALFRTLNFPHRVPEQTLSRPRKRFSATCRPLTRLVENADASIVNSILGIQVALCISQSPVVSAPDCAYGALLGANYLILKSRQKPRPHVLSAVVFSPNNTLFGGGLQHHAFAQTQQVWQQIPIERGVLQSEASKDSRIHITSVHRSYLPR